MHNAKGIVMNMICKSLLSQNLHFRVENTASKKRKQINGR